MARAARGLESDRVRLRPQGPNLPEAQFACPAPRARAKCTPRPAVHQTAGRGIDHALLEAHVTHLPLSINPHNRLVVEVPPGCGFHHIRKLVEAALGHPVEGARNVLDLAPAPSPPPDGLRTPAEAARKLRCSVKTLNAHVAAGALRYVDIGRGRKRARKMFTDSDLNEFIANQSRKDVPCPSTRTETVVRRISISTSKCEVIGFTARRNARRAAKPKK
jgi:hypothetical protein